MTLDVGRRGIEQGPERQPVSTCSGVEVPLAKTDANSSLDALNSASAVQ